MKTKSPLHFTFCILPARLRHSGGHFDFRFGTTLIAVCLWTSVGLCQTAPLTKWQVFVDSLEKAREIKGLLIHVEAPKHNISWTSASGISDVNTQHELTGHEPVRIASITKSFVATGILGLWENKKLSDHEVHFEGPCNTIT